MLFDRYFAKLKYMRFLSLVVFILIWGGCKTYKNSVVTVYGDSTALNNEIAFFHFKVSKSIDGKAYSGEVMDVKKASGRLDIVNNTNNLEAGKWLISYIDKNENIITSDCISNPLDEYHEYLNDKGELSQANIKKNEADFFSRIQYNKKIKYIKIELIKEKNKLNSLLKIEI